MTAGEAAIVLLGALAGGFVNGLTGFGTGLTALGIWLYALPPATAATLVIVTSVASQLQTLPLIWHRLDWPRARRFVLPGLLAAPAGAAALAFIEPRPFKVGVGIFLVLYVAAALRPAAPVASAWGGRLADAVIGLAGGFLGGLAGLSGALVVLWTDLRGDAKEARRSLLQAFNLSILLVALASHAVGGRFGRDMALAIAAALPGTMLGAWLGSRLYRRLGDGDYRRIVLVLLLVSGLALVATSL